MKKNARKNSRRAEIDWKKELIRADESRETNAETAERLDCNIQYVSNARTVLGLNRRQGCRGGAAQITHDEVSKKAYAMRKRGATMVDCWQELGGGVSRSVFIYRYLSYVTRLHEKQVGIRHG